MREREREKKAYLFVCQVTLCKFNEIVWEQGKPFHIVCSLRFNSIHVPSAQFFLHLPALPKPPGTPIVTETTATSVTITWDSGNPDPVSYYIIQYRAKAPDSKYETVDGITTTRYSIGGLYPNTEYEIRVSAFNSIGQGPPSMRVEARTGEQAPASPPRNVQARIISQNTVMVRWEEPEEPNGQVG